MSAKVPKRRTASVQGHPTPGQKAKLKLVMDEWKAGTLHSGSKQGPIVKSQKQAVAIALSKQSRSPASRKGAKKR